MIKGDKKRRTEKYNEYFILKDPLINFAWDINQLYMNYDTMCKKFNCQSEFLGYFDERPKTDRECYNKILAEVQRIVPLIRNGEIKKFPVELLIAIMYWKLYSQPAAVKMICKTIYDSDDLRCNNEIKFTEFLKYSPNNLQRNINEIVELITKFNDNKYKLYGVGSKDALPMRTTILHFIYPDIVSIFDKMVLKAVGINDENANKNINYFMKYQNFAWQLENTYDTKIKGSNFHEPCLRVIDMALWVNR